jgi:hypothetical protein
MVSREDLIQKRVTVYLSGLRSENTRIASQKVINFLLTKYQEQMDKRKDTHEWSGGWVRSGNIFSELRNDIPNSNTLTRVLNGLVESNLIERRDCQRIKGKPGKAPVFYRVPTVYDPILFNSHEFLIKAYKKCLAQTQDCMTSELAATMIFREYTGKDLKPLLKNKIKEIKEGQADLNNLEKIAAISETDPCESL